MNIFSKIMLFLPLLAAFPAAAQNVRHDQLKLKTIVLDPGHGGNDPGCVYGSYKEKDIVLSVALLLGDMLEKAYPDMKVVYTRKTDVFVPLSQRGIIANKAKGDLFLSIHVNSAASSAAQGSETFTLGLHKSAANLAVAQQENAVITLEDNYEKEYAGFSPGDPESYIMLSMGQQGFLRESIEFSDIIQRNYVKHAGMKDRGINQAGFLVLWRASSMPCVLTELGFIVNAADRKILTAKDGQRRLATALFNAVREYKAKVEKTFEYASAAKEEPAFYANGVPKKSCYSVQLISSRKKLDRSDRVFGAWFRDVIEVRDGKYYKYYVGMADSPEEIVSLRQRIRKSGFKDAYEVAFHEGKVIKASELKKALKK